MPRADEGWDAARENYLKDRRRVSQWDTRMLVFVLILALVGAAGITVLLWQAATGGFGNPRLSLARSYDRQVVGQRLAWRKLADLPARGVRLSPMAAGNFDADADPEIALHTQGTGYHLLELDGSISQLPQFPQNNWSMYLIAWDYDGDGVDDLLMQDYTTSPSIAVYGADGNKKHNFPMQDSVSFSCTGDYDGDGLDELLLQNYNGLTATVYSTNGSVLRTAASSGAPSSYLLTDIDNDGMAELVACEYQKYTVYGAKQTVVTPNWPQLNPGELPLFAADLTGDGIPELINPLGSMLDTTAQRLPLLFGTRQSSGNFAQRGISACTVFNSTAAGQPRLLVVPDCTSGSSIYMFDSAGSPTYQQDLKPGPTGCLTVTYQGREHLVVSTPEMIMIYP